MLKIKKELAFGLIEVMLGLLLLLAILLPLASSLNQQLKIFTDQKKSIENNQTEAIENCKVENLSQRIIINCADDELFFF